MQFSPQGATLTSLKILIPAISHFGLFDFNPDTEENLSKVINTSITEDLFLKI